MSEQQGLEQWSRLWAEAATQAMQAWQGMLCGGGEQAGGPAAAWAPWLGQPAGAAQANPFQAWLGAGQGAGPFPAWAGGGQAANPFQTWLNATGAAATPPLQQLLQSGAPMFGMAELLHQIQEWTKAGEASVKQYADALREGFERLSAPLANLVPMSTLAASAVPGPVGFPSAFGVMPPPAVAAMLGLAPSLTGGPGASGMALPGLGYTREAQERLQRGMRLWADYEAAQREYLALFAPLPSMVAERLVRRLEEIEAAGGQITTLRALAHLWAECADDAYREIALTDEHSVAYGRAVNALMALKCWGRRLIDDVLADLNMPNRRELDTLGRRQHELRRALRAGTPSPPAAGAAPSDGDREPASQTAAGPGTAAAAAASGASARGSAPRPARARTKPATRGAKAGGAGRSSANGRATKAKAKAADAAGSEFDVSTIASPGSGRARKGK